MKLLELFSGTKSVGKVAEQLGYEVTSLDLKMLILIVIFLIGSIPHTNRVILILFGLHLHVRNTVEQKR